MANLPGPPPIDYTALNKVLAAAPNTAGLAKVAGAQAQTDTNAVTASLRAQQAAEMQRAQQTAAALLGAAQAASGQLSAMDLGGHQADALRQAALDQAGLASGFSGQLRESAGEHSATLLRALEALHAPGGAPNTGDQAANAVYGIGKLPADAMLAAAPFAEAQARALPAQLLAHGQQNAAGALGAGAQAAHELDPQIAAALAKQPALAREYLSDLQKAAADAREASIGNMFKALTLQQRGYEQEATRYYRQAQLDQHESDQAQRQWYQVQQLRQRAASERSDQRYRYDALDQRGRIAEDTSNRGWASLDAQAKKDAAAAAKKSTSARVTFKDGKGQTYLLDKETGAIVKLPVPGRPGAKQTYGGASAAQVADWRETASQIASRGKKGYWASNLDPNSPVTSAQVAAAVAKVKAAGADGGKTDEEIAEDLGYGYWTMKRGEALSAILAQGVPEKLARKVLARWYPPRPKDRRTVTVAQAAAAVAPPTWITNSGR